MVTATFLQQTWLYGEIQLLYISAAHRIQGAWSNGISGASVTKKKKPALTWGK
jgi:hypothetical protein